MRFTVPVYVQRTFKEEGSPGRYLVRPLFNNSMEEQDERLSLAVRRLAKDLRLRLRYLAKNREARALMEWSFCPAMEDHRYDIPVELRRQTIPCRFLVVAFKALDRKVAFSPSLPNLWFDVIRGESLQDRAIEAIGHHYREQERLNPKEIDPKSDGIMGKAFVTTIELEVKLPAVHSRKGEQQKKYAAVAFDFQMSGAAELEKVGENLDWLYPDDLDRAVQRDMEVEELTRMLRHPDMRPVLLLGPRLSGKTTILHEYLHRTISKRGNPYTDHRNVWQISPMRLISGMSFVGQWEARLLAIIREARRRRHVLYFDDLLGLYLAGLTSQSSLSVAQVLKPYLESREVRVLAEATPETFRVLQERDRGMADLFHVIRVEETSQVQTLDILIDALRQLEGRYDCRFNLDVLPLILELHDRYMHDASYPGKAAQFARRLAVKYRRSWIGRGIVLEEFQAFSGLSLQFLNRSEQLQRAKIEEGLRQNLTGQEEALQAVTNAISRAKAQLNDPERPLTTLLFVGPTGVGKTQCAKAAATFLFRDAERLVRFDMNEFVDAHSAARLVGTFAEPEGLLTSKVRQRPFCVLLFDEIEKAHPDVFDLLLQVLGEGRLTDARGRTVDFRNALILLTSNLGVRESRSQIGFDRESDAERQVFIEAARRFFRPEFFNRIDRIVPFRPLSKEEIADIANRLIHELLGRHGLQQRWCDLDVDEEVTRRITEAGYHPQLGARALKRVIEQQLAQPIANSLAALPPGVPTLIAAYAGKDGLEVRTQGLVPAEQRQAPGLPSMDPVEVYSAVESLLDRGDEACEAHRPEGHIPTENLDPAHMYYITLCEQLRSIRHAMDRFHVLMQKGKHDPKAQALRIQEKPQRAGRRWIRLRLSQQPERSLIKELANASDVDSVCRTLGQDVPEGLWGPEESARALLTGCSLLEAMLRDPTESRVLICAYCAEDIEDPFMETLRDFYATLAQTIWGWHFEDLGIQDGRDPAIPLSAWVISGHGVEEVLMHEAGTQVETAESDIIIANLSVVPLDATDDPTTTLSEQYDRRSDWIRRLGEGGAKDDEYPIPCTRVRRQFILDHGDTSILDYRSGWMSEWKTPPGAIRAMVLEGLPLPADFTAEE